MDNMKLYSNDTLENIKGIIKKNIETACSSFNAVGFYLKNIRDRELYKQEGFDTIWDFAKAEFGLGKSSASRFMAINDRFSVDGNSPALLDEYKKYSSSKLSEMLTLDDDQIEKVTENTTVREIREMKSHKDTDQESIPGQRVIEDYPEVLPESEDVAMTQQVSTIEMVRYSVPNRIVLNKILDIIINNSKEDAIKKVSEVMLNGCAGSNFAGEWSFARFTGFKYTFKDSSIQHYMSWARYIECIKEDNKNHFDNNVECNEEDTLHEDVTVNIEIEQGDHSHEEIQPEPVDEQTDVEIDEVPAFTESTLDMARYMLNKEKQKLVDAKRTFVTGTDSDKKIVSKIQITADALESYINQLSSKDEIIIEEVHQQELPVMKNNDQRKEFIDTYKEWPVWIDQELTGERFYKYDFDNNISFVVKVSMKHRWEKGKYSEDIQFAAEEYYLTGVKHEYYTSKQSFEKNPTVTFAESKTNKSALIDYLKEYQKVVK